MASPLTCFSLNFALTQKRMPPLSPIAGATAWQLANRILYLRLGSSLSLQMGTYLFKWARDWERVQRKERRDGLGSLAAPIFTDLFLARRRVLCMLNLYVKLQRSYISFSMQYSWLMFMPKSATLLSPYKCGSFVAEMLQLKHVHTLMTFLAHSNR